MIRYALKCTAGHQFESWFKSADAFDALSRAGQLSCTMCGTSEVTKSLMAPRVSTEAGTPEAQPMAAGPLSAPGTEMERMVAELRKKVEENSTYVGRGFASEARQQHLGEAPERQIHGEATANEARELIDDGVPVLPLPGLPKSKAN